ncbi:phenoloxidase-activating enzyme-like [Galleria mellonella]|uniref:CLIP domain-containing serine protease n=1 Tax=Galleria mellonella TaxID=7137 RepID=A0ABM3MDW9_GALME|nr:phenoloxidase-activating enzyme-like [Galleria mellonella]
MCDKIIYKMKFILIIFASVSTLCFVRGQSCSTPSGGRGQCISILNCPPLVTIINKKERTQQDLDLLRKSQCGFEGQTPKVCCPEQCYTPDGEAGKCIGIYSCPHLAAMLKPPSSKQNIQYVQNSKCDGPEQYSVCCGTPREQPQVGNCENRVNAFPPDPSTECCGVDSGTGNKIIGGTATTIDQYPWLTLIEYTKDGVIKTLCGGALISARYILTAGHCVVGAVLDLGTPKNIRLGEYDTSNDGSDCVATEGGGEDCSDPPVIIPIERSIPHPQYDPTTRKNDIALIRMRQNAPFTDFIRPICLPTMDITLNPPSNFRLFVAGWGAVNETINKSNIKLHVSVPFVNSKECVPVYSHPKRRASLWNKQLCAGGEKDKDSCKGDSGGPLMYENGRIYELVGVVSFGPKPCGVENIPGVYTKVYEYNTWIRSTIRP